MKIQGESQLHGRQVVDVKGRPIGRVLRVHCAPDPYTAAWLVLRLRGWGHRLRAVPAVHAAWDSAGSVRVPYRRDHVVASPAVGADSIDCTRVRRAVETYYSSPPPTSGPAS